MKLGIDRLLQKPELRRLLKGQRVALLAHPASVTENLEHSLDALAALPDIQLSAAFGPQHGLRRDAPPLGGVVRVVDQRDVERGRGVGHRHRDPQPAAQLALVVDRPQQQLVLARSGGPGHDQRAAPKTPGRGSTYSACVGVGRFDRRYIA